MVKKNIAFILLVSLFFIGCLNKKTQNIIENINNNNIDVALQGYEELNNNEKLKVDEFIKELIDK